MRIIIFTIMISALTQFHSVTRVESNSNLAKAKSAFSAHDTRTLKKHENEFKNDDDDAKDKH